MNCWGTQRKDPFFISDGSIVTVGNHIFNNKLVMVGGTLLIATSVEMCKYIKLDKGSVCDLESNKLQIKIRGTLLIC